MTRLRRALTTLVCIAATFGVTGSAHAVGWVTGPPVSEANAIATDPQIALTPSGERIVAWRMRW